MDQHGNVQVTERNEQEKWNVTEWEASDDENEASSFELAKRTLIAGWLEDFWLDDYDDDDENSDDEAINLDNGLIGDNGGDEDEADFPFRRKTKKNKTIESSNKSTTKQREIVGGATKPLSSAERPPSETVAFTSADNMRLQTPFFRLSNWSTSEDEDTTERPKHYCIAREVLTSEITYVKGLHLVEKAFRGAINTFKQLIPDKVMRTIFSNLGEIYKLHQEMQFDLQKRISNWDENPRIGDILADRAPYFKMYSVYSSEFEASQVTLAKWRQTCRELADIIERVESSPASKAMPITSFMLTPIQRVPRYKLLLTNYLRSLPIDSPDVKDTKKALQAVSEAATHMDELCKKLDNFQKVIKIQQRLIGNSSIVKPGRAFVAKGPVYCVNGKHLKPCIIFLFSDIWLVTKISRLGLYKILEQLEVKGLKVQDVKTEALPNTFAVIGTQVHRYQAKSQEEKMKWMTALDTTIKQFTEGWTVETFAKRSSMMQNKKRRAAIAKVDDDVFTDGINELPLPDTELVLESFCQISGYLEQKSASCDRWHRRWFVVANLRMYLYQNHEDDIAVGFQFLSGCSVSRPDQDDGIARGHVFKLTLDNGLTCLFQTDSQYDIDRWMRVLSVAGLYSEESAV